MKPVKQYLEYRDYLKDYYEEKKQANPYFSYRYMGRRVSIDASHLVKILQKQRHIGNKSIETFIDFCALSDSDAEYFETLVRFNKSRSDRDCKNLYERLLSLAGVKSLTLEKGQYEYYTKWYYSAILTLLDFYEFNGDYKALGAKLSPPISGVEAKKAVALLLKLGLIAKGPRGSYKLTNKIVSTGEQCRSIAVKAYQEETIRLAAESLYRHPREKRNISTVTITIAESDLDDINDIIKRFRSTLLKFAHDKQKPDSVYQLNVQLFPLTQKRV
jgi:uncharacterized protein (TIGR02147 family)